MEYKISQSEINRRKRAYTTLSISIIIGTIISSTIFNFHLSIEGYLLVVTALFLLGAFAYIFFHNLLNTKVNLIDSTLERITQKHSEKYLLSEVTRIKIKRTTNNTIREIYIWLNNGESVIVTALAKFENFERDLLKRINTSIEVTEIHEPVNYDHPIFYSFLGLPISAFGILLIKSLPSLKYQQIGIGIKALIIYLLVIGLYFIFVKPISARSGKKTASSDYFMGLLMIFIGIIFNLLF